MKTHTSQKAPRLLPESHTDAVAIAGTDLSPASATEPEIAASNAPFGEFEPPKGWTPPPLDPSGVQLQTKELGHGVYALLSNQPPVNNSGFIVGDDTVLVIDAHINGDMARQIQAAVRRTTDKPIAFLVNTNAHGDHTFGNHAFPSTTTIIAHREAAREMRRFESEKALMTVAVGRNAATVLDGVRLRLPDITYDEHMTIDLGGRVVDLHHFGHGNTLGDTVVYEAETKTAWTGNLVLGAKSIPWAIEGDTRAYLSTMTRLATRLDIETIVPGHVLTTTGAEIGSYLRYLGQHIQAVSAAVRSGKTLEQTLTSMPLDESYMPPEGSPLARARPLMQGFHKWNVKKTYQELRDR